MTAITLPLLEGIAKHWNRPQIVYPDLVELNSGFWDLRKYTEGASTALSLPARRVNSPLPVNQRTLSQLGSSRVRTPRTRASRTRTSSLRVKSFGSVKLARR